MAVLSQRLDLRQSTALVMTPQLQQAIKLLQMSNQELGDFIESEIEQNPLLERAEDAAPREEIRINPPSKEGAEASVSGVTASNEPAAPEVTPEITGASEPAAESFDDNDDFRETGLSGTASRGESEEGFEAAQNVAERPSLRDHLLGQIHMDFTDPAERLMAAALLELLDEAGYLPGDLEAARCQLGATPEQMEAVIAKLQRMDPAGIFARSLTECLAAQLREKNRLDPAMAVLLQNLDLLAKRDKPALMKKCGVDAEDLAEMIDEIRNLDPKPAAAFTADVAIPIAPDVLLRPQSGGGWHIELNSETLPRVLANERYYTDVLKGAHDKKEKDYLSERWQQASWLVKALHQRATTILRVSAEIVKQQEKFFAHGLQFLKPMVLRDIAAAVEMHESTISRVTQNKYIATPRGLFELKFFFTNAINTTGGVETVASVAVKERIKSLVDEEKPDDILSDDKLVDLLRREGIHIARRTVAKYREALKIPSSAQRRRNLR